MAWTDERVGILKKLWMEGLSASQIAGELGEGVTRNAVIGKVHRLKLSGRAKPAASAPRARKPRANSTGPSVPRRPAGGAVHGSTSSAPRRRQSVHAPVSGANALQMNTEVDANVALATAQEAEIFIPVEERISLMQLNETTCKWPIGDPLNDDFHFCGRDSDEGKPYCEFHSKRAYHQLDRRKRS
ncbi:GcrA family cell cycle regulator [Maritalea sp.]|jgi:GcrA cell cycle regulator|uniref:GcrA family cell cycle regulator n=1 Tax=Maritalea sp. TaxID=2003361 RepID=UPI0039E60F46